MNTDKMFKPFEICSIRPPTENQSLTFRLTRNCYWNKCTFCPVYKLGSKFIKRSIDDVKSDIYFAKRLNDKLDEFKTASDVSGSLANPEAAEYHCAQEMIEQIQQAQGLETDYVNHAESVGVDTNLTDDPVTGWFMQWFKETPTIADSVNHLVSWRLGGGRSCFLGDADSLILKPLFVKEVIDTVKTSFPSIHRFTVYGRTVSASRLRTLSELKEFRSAGLNRVHFGIESGSDAVLKRVCKGETKNDHISGCLKTKEAGLSCSIYVMPGLGGQQYSEEHASETADVITQTAPDFVRMRTLQVFPNTPLAKQREREVFVETTEEQVVSEIRQMILKIDARTQIISDSATNLLNVNGRLPEDRRAMLHMIDSYLALSLSQKKLFSLQIRLQAFEGQYGGFSEDIYGKLMPFINNATLDISSMPEATVDDLIYLIRSKLMP
ncbi:MAG: radical SAM protein [Desulfobacteraceae bacterium]|nr:radical SAM protein [Desulfobacteraceae bacterium]MBC2755722.1 radical SAM protein [Desulfobacteraceae bacterium]